MPSPPNPSPKAEKPWPSIRDIEKPLPRTPEAVKRGTSEHTDSVQEEDWDITTSPAWEASDRKGSGGHRAHRKRGSAKKFDLVDKEQSGDIERHGLAPLDTPKTSSESLESFQSSKRGSFHPKPREYSDQNIPITFEKNPFRRKEISRASPRKSSLDNGSRLSRSEPEDAKIAKHEVHGEPFSQGSINPASKRVDQGPPQLNWSGSSNTSTLPDFSKIYEHGLEELRDQRAAEIEGQSPSLVNSKTESLPAPSYIGLDYSEKAFDRSFASPPKPPSSHDQSITTHEPNMDNSISDSAINSPTQQVDLSKHSHSEKSGNDTASTPQQSKAPAKRKTGEMYQIRQINWLDHSSKDQSIRKSPIMVQNANGPCPLLALVNALVLSTPSDLPTPLQDTLSSRENITLGFLLDAVIDELMSGRRGNADQNLPDVSEMYGFLVSLHTGMSVNPQFVVIKEQPESLIDAPIDSSAATEPQKLGTFGKSIEMDMYSPFSIPLIHGWIPARSHPAFGSLTRIAKTYEDAQNVLFQEEDLETKLKSQGLTTDEQDRLADIANVKYFLSSTATQLTTYGLDSITETLAPGSISILFRNDHFSTLYKHPKSGQLFTLVTDMGYAGHDEVVWESLVDVSGEGCEFFAGDFRPVGNVDESTEQQTVVDAEGWQTVARRPRRNTRTSQNSNHAPTTSISKSPANEAQPSKPPPQPERPTSTEQEDHDLALAMQLQEEEEDRHRRDAAARRREDELSERYLSNSDPATGRRTFPGFGRGAQRGGGSGGRGSGNSSGGGPQVPPRGRGSGSTNTNTSTTNANISNTNATTRASAPSSSRPAVHRRPSSSDDAPPPSYEQAAKNPAYHPPPDHPAHPNANATTTTTSSSSPIPSPGLPHRPPPLSLSTLSTSAPGAATTGMTGVTGTGTIGTGMTGMRRSRGDRMSGLGSGSASASASAYAEQAAQLDGRPPTLTPTHSTHGHGHGHGHGRSMRRTGTGAGTGTDRLSGGIGGAGGGGGLEVRGGGTGEEGGGGGGRREKQERCKVM